MPPKSSTPPSDFEQAMAAAGAAVAKDKAEKDLTAAAAEVFKEEVVTNEEGAVVADVTVHTAKRPAVRQMSLAEKLCTIMLELPDDLQPQEWNEKQGYWFWSIEQITGLLRGRFAAAGIIFLPNITHYDIRERVTKAGGSSWMTTLMIEITLRDVTTGEEIVRTSIGQGDDTGDKGSNKAFTGAIKTWLKYLFLIGGKDDAELDEATDERWDDRDNRDNRDEVRRSGRDTRDDGTVRVEASDIEGIERGGRATRATEVQITRVRDLARQAGISLNGIADVIEKVLQDHLDLPRAAGEARDTILAYLERLSSDSIGLLIAELADIAEAAQRDQGPLDDDPGYGS